MNIKETLKHIWFGTKMLASVGVVMTTLYFMVSFAPWLLVVIAGLWAAWFIGDMFK